MVSGLELGGSRAERRRREYRWVASDSLASKRSRGTDVVDQAAKGPAVAVRFDPDGAAAEENRKRRRQCTFKNGVA